MGTKSKAASRKGAPHKLPQDTQTKVAAILEKHRERPNTVFREICELPEIRRIIDGLPGHVSPWPIFTEKYYSGITALEVLEVFSTPQATKKNQPSPATSSPIMTVMEKKLEIRSERKLD